MNAATKRTLTLSMAIGISVELSIWAFLYFVVGEDAVLFRRFIWIERLQEAGMKAGEVQRAKPPWLVRRALPRHSRRVHCADDALERRGVCPIRRLAIL